MCRASSGKRGAKRPVGHPVCFATCGKLTAQGLPELLEPVPWHCLKEPASTVGPQPAPELLLVAEEQLAGTLPHGEGVEAAFLERRLEISRAVRGRFSLGQRFERSQDFF